MQPTDPTADGRISARPEPAAAVSDSAIPAPGTLDLPQIEQPSERRPGAGSLFRPSRLSRISVPDILLRKRNGPKIAALTAYDFTTAVLADRCEVDIILIGDSLSSTVQGHETTLPVTLEEMIYHSRCVTRAVRRSLVLGDLPFMSYQVSPEQAIISAGRLVKEGGVHAVKLEGGTAVKAAIEKITAAEIPVVGHIGLTPQSYLRMGGYKVQGKKRDTSGGEPLPGTRERLIEDALAVEEAGAFALVLEGIPSELGKAISELVSIPTIGIGAGPDCDGQILVTADFLGLSLGVPPKFVKRYAELGALTAAAMSSYVAEVRSGQFPLPEHCYGPGTELAQMTAVTEQPSPHSSQQLVRATA